MTTKTKHSAAARRKMSASHRARHALKIKEAAYERRSAAQSARWARARKNGTTKRTLVIGKAEASQELKRADVLLNALNAITDEAPGLINLNGDRESLISAIELIREKAPALLA